MFCTSTELPPLRDVLEWAEGHGVNLEASVGNLEGHEWQQAEIVYRREKQPFVVEASTDELVKEEVEEFVELLEDAGDSPEKQRVLDHLRQSDAVVVAQLLGDIDDDGYEAAGTFLSYFVNHSGGLIQAEGEGFYDGDQLIVKLP